MDGNRDAQGKGHEFDVLKPRMDENCVARRFSAGKELSTGDNSCE
jgi:hypothetical protein